MTQKFSEAFMTMNIAQKSMVLFAFLSPLRYRFLNRQNMLTLVQCELLADAILPDSVMYKIFSSAHQWLFDQYAENIQPELLKKMLCDLGLRN